MTRNDLKRILELRQEINRALNLWENALASAIHTTAVITGMPKGNSMTSKVENAVIKSETYKEHYDALCDEQHELFQRLNAEAKRLDETERKIILYVYLNGKRISDIAKELKMSERHVYRVKKTAVNKICY